MSGTSPTRASRPPATSRCGCTGRCSWRARPASARPRSRTRSPRSTGRRIYRLQCYEGLEASQALYDWDFGRQILHLRAAEAAARRRTRPRRWRRASTTAASCSPGRCCRRSRTRPSVLLVDEVDRADDEFEAFLLEVLADFAITIPELGTDRRARRRRWSS